jgi:hypothetical protein
MMNATQGDGASLPPQDANSSVASHINLSQTNDAENLWQAHKDIVANYKDGRNRPMDPGIASVVLGLNAHGLATTMSCEGHSDRGLGFPMVTIGKPAYFLLEYRGQEEVTNEQLVKLSPPEEMAIKNPKLYERFPITLNTIAEIDTIEMRTTWLACWIEICSTHSEVLSEFRKNSPRFKNEGLYVEETGLLPEAVERITEVLLMQSRLKNLVSEFNSCIDVSKLHLQIIEPGLEGASAILSFNGYEEARETFSPGLPISESVLEALQDRKAVMQEFGTFLEKLFFETHQ